MKFMVTSRKGAAAAVAFLLATPVVALTGLGGGVALARGPPFGRAWIPGGASCRRRPLGRCRRVVEPARGLAQHGEPLHHPRRVGVLHLSLIHI